MCLASPWKLQIQFVTNFEGGGGGGSTFWCEIRKKKQQSVFLTRWGFSPRGDGHGSGAGTRGVQVWGRLLPPSLLLAGASLSQGGSRGAPFSSIPWRFWGRAPTPLRRCGKRPSVRPSGFRAWLHGAGERLRGRRRHRRPSPPRLIYWFPYLYLFIYLFIYLFSSFLLLSNSVEPTHIGMHFFGQERISEAPQTQRCNCSSAGHYPALTVPGVNSKHHHMHHTHTHTPLHPTKMTGTLPPWGEKMTDFRLQTRSHMVLFTFCLPTLRLLLLDSLLNSI